MLLERTIVSDLRSRLGPGGPHAEKGMQVDDVRSARLGDDTLIEVRFRHRTRPGSSFVVRFSLTDGNLLTADEEWNAETTLAASTVIWANMVEIAALPNDYLPRGAGRGDIEVVA